MAVTSTSPRGAEPSPSPRPASADRRTRGRGRHPSIIRNATLPTRAGKPPADGAQPFGMKGMMLTVDRKVMHEPAAPRTPSRLFQKPKNSSAPNNHSDTPRNQLAPRTPKTGYIQEMSRPLLMNGISTWASYSNHFWKPNRR